MRKLHIIIPVVIAIIAAAVLMATVGKKNDRVQVNAGPKEDFLKEAEAAIKEGDSVAAKRYYKKAMESIENAGQLKEIQKKLAEISTKIIFSPVVDECGVMYEVKPNDALSKIARKYKTTVELIKRANNLTSDVIIPGQKLKVNTCRFSVVVDKSQNMLFLKQGDELVRTYVVSTGKDNSTPVGNFKIVTKLENPTWFKTGAVIPPDSQENILGTRWMGLDLRGYGIHGTTQPEHLGEQVTLGCVRMSNEDVEELYSIVPVGTEVTVVD